MASAAVASFLDAYKDILWAMRALMAPSILAEFGLSAPSSMSGTNIFT